jgi:uncharacterized protein YndB with AHSA1/START domain
MSHHRHHVPSFLFLLSLFMLPAPGATIAGIVDSSASGFTVRTTVVVRSSPDDAYRAVTGSIGEWWNPEHTYSGKSENLSIDVLNNGCFCEMLGNGGIVRHMTVVYANPGKALRLSGGLGPLQGMGAAGSLTWDFKPSSVGTAIEMTYTVGGYAPGGLGSLAPAVDRVLAEQMDRLKNFIETGKPGPAGAPGR